jgi:hypothetical protein
MSQDTPTLSNATASPAAAIDRAKTSVPSISVAALTARSLTGAAPLCRTRLDTFVDTEARKPRG